jgi:hypothetical protein
VIGLVWYIKCKRVQNETIIWFVHGNTNNFKGVHVHVYVLTNTYDSLSEDHKTRIGIESAHIFQYPVEYSTVKLSDFLASK